MLQFFRFRHRFQNSIVVLRNNLNDPLILYSLQSPVSLLTNQGKTINIRIAITCKLLQGSSWAEVKFDTNTWLLAKLQVRGRKLDSTLILVNGVFHREVIFYKGSSVQLFVYDMCSTLTNLTSILFCYVFCELPVRKSVINIVMDRLK